MRHPSPNSSPISKSIAAIALLALLVTGTFYVLPQGWTRATKNAPAANSLAASAPPPAIRQNAPAQAPPIVTVKAAPPISRKPAPEETKSAALSAALQQIPVSPKSNDPSKLEAKKQAFGKDEFRMQADKGSAEAGGETGEDPKLRADYFYRQRAYPFDQTPAGALQQSRQQLDAMITQQRAMGILPEEGAATSSVGFPGPANWTNLGPQPVNTNAFTGSNFGNPAATGRVTAIAVDPTTTNPASQVVYLGAATGGVWKSTDGGSSWNTIFDQNNSLAIGGIGIDPSNHNTIYVGTGELNFSGDSYYGAGIYKSTDGGTNWTQQCGGASVNFCIPTFSGPFQGGGFFVGDIAVNPANSSVALAAVRDAGNGSLSGIYRTTDGGANWALIPSASGSAGNSIVWNPSDSTVVYATLGQTGTNAGVFKSTDSGVTFTKLTGSLPNLPTTNLGRHVLAVAPSNGNVVYVSIDNNSTNSLLGLAKSTDGGATWTFTTPGTLPSLPNFCSGQCWYDMAIAVLPNDPNTLVVGGSAFTNNSSTDFRSSDGGTTWVDITTGSTAVRPHVDTHAMRFAATTSGFRLYTGNDGGIWFTDNPTAAPGTLTWQPGNNANLTITQFYPGHAVNPSDENISFGGTQDNGIEKYSGALAWDHVTCGDGAWAAVDPVITSTVYANCQNIAIVKSTLDGVPGSWSTITNELSTSGDRSLFIPPLVQDQNQSGRLYFGTFRVWQSQTYGNDWNPISPDLTSSANNEVTSVSVAQSNNNVVYATTTDGRVWRTTNANAGAGATWTNLTKAPLPGRYATMVRTDHGNPDSAYLSYSGFSGFVDSVGHIFKTTDGGTTWTDISGTAAGALPNTPVNDIAVVHLGSPLNFDAVFIATDVGVFECANPTAATPCQTWTPVGTGLPKVPVVGLAYRESSATLRAVTHGRGVWVMETPGITATGLLLLTSITPSSAASGSGSFTMTFDGNDFGLPSGTPQILFDGADPGVTNITLTNSNHMTATIPASVTANPGWHQITINQPGHAANPQNPTCCISFNVTGPAPTLTLINPTQANTGSASFPLTLTGTNFVCGATPAASLVQFGTTQLNPSTCSSTSMTATIPSNLLTTPGTANVKAFNPGPGGGNSGAIAFTIGSPATNDNFANAKAITSLPFTDTESTGAATTEVGEPVPSSLCIRGLTVQSASTHSIWYSYTPSSSGVVSFTSPGETENGIIQVVTGSALGALTPVAGGCSLDINTFFAISGSAATVKVSAGVTYHIMLSDYSGTGATAVLSAAAATAPINDDFANAITVNTVGFGDTRTTTGATTEVGEPIPASACTSAQAASTHSVWYRYTPGSSGTAVFNTIGSSTDSIIQVVTGSLGGFSAVTGGCADNGAQGVGESVTFSVTSGTTYFIMVSDWNGIGGTSVLNFLSGPAPSTTSTVNFSPTTIPFGNQVLNTTSAQSTSVLTNSGATTLTITSVTLTGTDPGDYALVVPASGTDCRTIGTVAAASTCTIAVTFTPTALGSRPATVSVSDSATGSPHTLPLTGTGTFPQATPTPSPVPFGNQRQNTTSSVQVLTLTNGGTDTLHLTTVALGGTNPGDFAIATGTTCTNASTVIAGATCIVNLTFTPTALGSRTATITFTDDANPTTQIVNLTGTGTFPQASPFPTPLPFGNQRQNTTSTVHVLTLSNGGTDTLHLTTVALGGTNPGDFAVGAGTTCTNGSTVTAGSSCIVNLTFTPTALNARSATITFTDDASPTTQIVSLTGTGILPQASPAPATVPFGNQTNGVTSAPQTVTLTNGGNGSLTLTTVALGGTNPAAFAIAAGTTCTNGAVVLAGANCVVNVTFTPSGVAAFSATLTFTDDASPTTQIVNLTGSGVTSTVNFSPTTIPFGNQRLNTTSAQSTSVLTNSGATTLTISGVTLTGTNPGDYALVTPASGTDCRTIGTVAAGTTCTVGVTFTPTALGSRTATVSVADNATGTPHSVPLTGTGIFPQAAPTPNPVPFANQIIATTSAGQMVTLTNGGTDTLHITTVALGGTDPTDFAIAAGTTCTNGSTVVASATCIVNLTFTPVTANPFSATLTFTDDANPTTQIVNLTGTGVTPPTATLSAGSLNFANQRVNTVSAAQNVTITNNGGAPLNITSSVIAGANASDFAFAAPATTCPTAASGQVAPGASCTLSVTFDPAAINARNAAINVTVTGITSPAPITLTGTGIAPSVLLAPTTAPFGNQEVNTASTAQSGTLTNSGTDTLHITAVAITGANASDFSIVAAGTSCATGLPTPVTVAATANCTWSVKFTPTALGARTASLTFTDDSGAVAGSAQAVALTGTGTAPVVLLAPTSVTFPPQVVSTTSAPMNGTLTNTGTTTLHLTTVAITGTNAGDFAIVGAGTTCTNSSTVAASNGSCTWSVTFTPSAIGTRTASLNFTDDNNGVVGAVQTVPLTGVTPPAATLSTAAVNFGNQGVATTSSPSKITLTNPGGSPLHITTVAISGTNAAEFSIAAAGTTCTNGSTVAPTLTCDVNIAFTPGSVGARGPATVTFTDDASPTMQTATLSGTGIDFAETGPGAAVTVTSGQTANFTITITPAAGGFPNAITFAASGLPAASTPTFTPPSVTPGGTAATTTFSVATTLHGSTFPGSTAPAAKPWTMRPFALLSFTLAAILLALITFGRTGRRRRLTPAMFATVALLLAIGVTGCTSGPSGTPAGTSTITVTATSGALVHTTTVTLTVQ